MKAFAALYTALDESTSLNDKVSALEQYFRLAAPADAAWAITFLVGRRLAYLHASFHGVSFGSRHSGLRSHCMPVRAQNVWNGSSPASGPVVTL